MFLYISHKIATKINEEYDKLLKHTKNEQKATDKPWWHQSLCLYHVIFLLGRQYFTEDEISPLQWKMCQCNTLYQHHIRHDMPKFKYRIGLNEIFKDGKISDLNIMINNDHNKLYKIPLIDMDSQAIAELMESCTRPNQIGTGLFHDSKLVFQLNENIWIVMRQKNRYRQKEIQIPENTDSLNGHLQKYIFQCWAVYGICHHLNQFTRYIAIHNNPYCIKPHDILTRIVLYIHSSQDFEIVINGRNPKSYKECDAMKKQIIENNRQREKANHKRKFEEIDSMDNKCDVKSVKKIKLSKQIEL